MHALTASQLFFRIEQVCCCALREREARGRATPGYSAGVRGERQRPPEELKPLICHLLTRRRGMSYVGPPCATRPSLVR
jgi:hypothetical protein